MTSRQERHEWLKKHGYISYPHGIECLSARALILLADIGGSQADEVQHVDTSSGYAWFSPDTLRAMKRGSNTLQAHYGTDDMETILYKEARRRAIDDTPL